MRKSVFAAIALTAALACAAPAYAANADVYARDTGSGGLCFSTNATAAECAPNEIANVSIEPGETVTWHFDGSTQPHNAADSEHGSSPEWAVPGHFMFVTSGDYPHQFDAEGTYEFFCEAHNQMKGTVTVGNPPPDDPPDEPPPPPPPPSSPPPTTTQPTTPAPSASADKVKPSVKRVKLKALRRAVRVRFRLSEPATVTVRVRRGHKVLKSKRVQAGAGVHKVTLRSKRLKQKGRYTVEIRARDASGNRSRLARKRLSLRR